MIELKVQHSKHPVTAADTYRGIAWIRLMQNQNNNDFWSAPSFATDSHRICTPVLVVYTNEGRKIYERAGRRLELAHFEYQCRSLVLADTYDPPPPEPNLSAKAQAQAQVREGSQNPSPSSSGVLRVVGGGSGSRLDFQREPSTAENPPKEECMPKEEEGLVDDEALEGVPLTKVLRMRRRRLYIEEINDLLDKDVVGTFVGQLLSSDVVRSTADYRHRTCEARPRKSFPGVLLTEALSYAINLTKNRLTPLIKGIANNLTMSKGGVLYHDMKLGGIEKIELREVDNPFGDKKPVPRLSAKFQRAFE